MDSVVDKSLIQQYAKRNTSSKMQIEQQYVQAFVDSILNSTELKKAFTTLSDELQNGDAFVIFNSFGTTARNINKEPFRSILAYSMLKKDLRLFELISASMFTGVVAEYHGNDLYGESAKMTDETPKKYTDNNIFTDMSIGRIQIGFKNIFTTDILPDGTGSEYQSFDELEKALEAFDDLITLTKPARIGVLLFYVPYCFITGDDTSKTTINMTVITSPFEDQTSMDILNNTSDMELMRLYRSVSHVKYTEVSDVTRPIDSTRTIIKGDGFWIYRYEFKTSTTANDINVWDNIKILSSSESSVYIPTDWQGPDTTYFEKYNPIMLRLEDREDAPCIACTVEGGTCTVGAMFFVQDKAD